jgi:Arc/MetJ-type ribon-helix-helix transcriptional regulator
MMYYHTRRLVMASAKIAITISETVLYRLDNLVQQGMYPNRSKAIQAAVEEKVAHFEHGRLAEALSKLDPAEEAGEAEMGIAFEADAWPIY